MELNKNKLKNSAIEKILNGLGDFITNTLDIISIIKGEKNKSKSSKKNKSKGNKK